MNKSRLLVIHPKLRDYRMPLFGQLAESYHLRFFCWYKGDINADNVVYSKRGVFRRLLSIRDAIVLYKEIKSADLLLTSFLFNRYSLTAIIFARLLGVPIVVWEEKTQFFNDIRSRINSWIQKIISRYVDTFFVLGQPQRKALQIMGVKDEAIFVANEYPGLDYSLVSSEPIEGLNIDGKRVILFLGRFVAFKGIPFLLEAYSQLEDKYQDLLLLCVGKGPLEEKLKNQAASLNLKNIVFTGYVGKTEQVKYLFENSRMMVIPSIISAEAGCEGGPLVVLEALSAGTPVLGTTGLLSSEQFIQNGVNGYVVPHSDSSALGEKMKTILQWDNTEAVRAKVSETFQAIKGHEFQHKTLKDAIDFIQRRNCQ